MRLLNLLVYLFFLIISALNAEGQTINLQVTDTLGVALENISNHSSAISDENGKIYGVLRSSYGASLFCIEKHSKKLQWIKRINKGIGSFKVKCLGEYVYVATYLPAILYKFSLCGNIVNSIEFDDEYIWDFDISDDDLIYIGTSPGARLFRTDLNFSEPQLLKEFEDFSYVRSLLLYNNSLFIGLGDQAALYRYDITHNNFNKINTSFFEDESFVYSLDSIFGGLIVGMDPSEELLYYDLYRNDIFKLQRTERIEKDSSFFHIGLRNIPYFIDLESKTFKKVLNENFIRFSICWREDNKIFALTSNGFYLESDMKGERNAVIDLLYNFKSVGDLSVLPMSIIVDEPYIYMGHVRLKELDVNTNNTKTLPVGVEIKAMLKVENDVYLATYPWCKIYRYNTISGDVDLLIEVGSSQNRPMDMVYLDESNQIAIASQPFYGKVGGAITIYNLDKKNIITWLDTINYYTPTQLAKSKRYRKVLYFSVSVKGGGYISVDKEVNGFYSLNIDNLESHFIEVDTKGIKAIEVTSRGIILLTPKDISLYDEESLTKLWIMKFKFLRNNLVTFESGNLVLVHDKNNIYLINLYNGNIIKKETGFNNIRRIFKDKNNETLFIIDDNILLRYKLKFIENE